MEILPMTTQKEQSPVAVHAAMNATDRRISRALGLAHILYAQAEDFPGLNNPEPKANGLMVLLDLLLDEIQAAQDAHEAEWRAIREANEGGAVQVAETPVMQLFRQWVDAASKLDAAAQADDEGWEVMLDRQTDLEDSILRAPAVDTPDFAAKVLAYCNEGHANLPNLPELWAEGRRVLGVTP
jgi:hypothetical protein